MHCFPLSHSTAVLPHTHTHTCTVNLAKRPLQAAQQLQLMKRAANVLTLLFPPSPLHLSPSLLQSFSNRSKTCLNLVFVNFRLFAFRCGSACCCCCRRYQQPAVISKAKWSEAEAAAVVVVVAVARSICNETYVCLKWQPHSRCVVSLVSLLSLSSPCSPFSHCSPFFSFCW